MPSLILQPITESPSSSLPCLLAPLSGVTLMFLYVWHSSDRSWPWTGHSGIVKASFLTLTPGNLSFMFMHSKLEQSFVGHLARWAKTLKVTCWNKFLWLHQTGVCLAVLELYLRSTFVVYSIITCRLPNPTGLVPHLMVSCFPSGYEWLFKRMKKVVSFRNVLDKFMNGLIWSGCLEQQQGG